MYTYPLHQKINAEFARHRLDLAGRDNLFYARLLANSDAIERLYHELYGSHPRAGLLFDSLMESIVAAYKDRPKGLRHKDQEKAKKEGWFLSNEIAGMSLYVDRFCGSLENLGSRLDYFETLGVNFLHLMPLFESPEGESDGGYAVSNFRKVGPRFGNLGDLVALRSKMDQKGMYLMVDIVLNHTSRQHQWAMKAASGDQKYQDYYYMFAGRDLPDEYEKTMPEIFPGSSPGSFTYVPLADKWVMSVFHSYQWDLNFSNPAVLVEMLENIFFYANLGVDILRIDAPAFIWKQLGTSCQNLPQAHTLLRLIRACVATATPGMALLGEAIVAPAEIMKYFGTGEYAARECDFAYNATQMALQWDMLATADTRIMLSAQDELLGKPYGASWITYTRSHDDIGLGYDDHMIRGAGFDPYQHRKFLQEYYSGKLPGSPASGALFSSNPKTGDARISGSLASLCGLEKAMGEKNPEQIELALKKILLMQAHSFFLGGVPILFYGDEAAYTNDYSYLDDPAKSYDNRWMHRPIIDWNKNKRTSRKGTIENRIFSGTQKLISIRRKLPAVGDYKNLQWLSPYNIHVAGFLRKHHDQLLFAVFNFGNKASYLSWAAFKEHGLEPEILFDHWSGEEFRCGSNEEFLIIDPYCFHLFEVVNLA